MLNLSFSTNAFRKYSLKEAVDAIAAAGYSGIEIMCDVPHAYPRDLSDEDIKEINRYIRSKRLTVSNLNAFMMCAIKDFHHPSWIEEDEDFRNLRIQHSIKCIDLASKLGAKSISTEPGGPLNGMQKNIAEEMFMEGLAKVVSHGIENDVVVLIEPEPGLLLQTSEDFLSFVDKFGTKGIGLNFDVGHFYCVGEDPTEKISELYKYIYHFHIEDIPANRTHQHVMFGEGGINIPDVIRAIEMSGFTGFVTVELYPYLNSAPMIAKKAMKFLKDISE